MKTKLISKILGVGLALGLTLSLGAAFIAAPAAQADEMEWGQVNTPSWEDLVILPGSDILDYAVGEDEGDIIYAVLEVNTECTDVGAYYDADGEGGSDTMEWGTWALVMSDDGGVTWTDITDNVIDASSLPFEAFQIESLNLVATAPDDEDWVAVAGYTSAIPSGATANLNGYVPFVVASEDGGDNFTFAHPLMDGDENMLTIMDMAVSPETNDGIHNIALAGTATVNTFGGTADPGPGAIFRLEAGTWLTGGWVDTRCYDGWDGSGESPCAAGDWDIWSGAVVAVDFSPNFDMDDTIVCMTIGYDGTYGYLPFLQEGILDSDDGAWNAEAGFSDAPLQITNEGEMLLTIGARYMMGFALPADFDGVDGSANNVYLYVNALNTVSEEVGGYVFISEDCADLSMRCGPSGDPLLASIDVYGDADTAKAVVGTLGVDVDFTGELPDTITFEMSRVEPCEGVAVWHTVELDDCCPEWECACKNPSGPTLAVVMYTPDGEKVFSTTSGSRTFLEDNDETGIAWSDAWGDGAWSYGEGNPLDESAFSVSLDDGVSFNQIGLIDTDIDWISDVQVCPDCSVIYMSTISEHGTESGSWPCIDDEYPYDDENSGWFDCDSIWRSYDDGDTWERINHGDWVSEYDEKDREDEEDGSGYPNILLRLPCDDLEECCTIYMGIQGTEDLYYSRDCGQCWNAAVNQKLTIQDFAVETENIVYILDEEGMVSASTQYGRRPSDGVDTEVGSGHSITSCCDGGVVVVAGAADEPVAWSDDGGESWVQTDDLDSEGTVHVACYDCDGDFTLFAATSGTNGKNGGIFRTTADSGEWDDLEAMPYGYYGIVMGRSDGTLYAAASKICVNDSECLCDRFVESGGDHYSGVARNLTPCVTDCCGTEDWDYLIAGIDTGDRRVHFDHEPSALRICGCISMDSNSVLYAIDSQDAGYEVIEGSDCTLWSYEDCAAKHGPELIAPEDEAIVGCDPCETCEGMPINFEWERMCLACSYDIEIMDEDGNVIASIEDITITGDPPTLYWDGTADYDPDDDDECASGMQRALECGQTYWWHVREANTETDECVHSPWSETWSFTIEASSANAVRLISPENGDMLTNRSGVGFSWTSVFDATSYSFVLSENPDLSSALATSDQSGTAYAYSGTLDYETTYYWQVTAWKNGTMLSQSDIATFSIAPEEVIPPTPEPTPPPEINIPPTQQIVPTWIYAVIGIGAALIVVVIVLIVRTRRP